MKKRYLNYTWEQLVDEDSFINWILHNKKDKEWRNFISKYPEVKGKVDKARELFSLLQDSYEVEQEDTIVGLWKNIKQYEQQNKPEGRIVKLHKSLGWAAAVLLVIILGTFLYLNQSDKTYQFASGLETDEAYMLLSNGELIPLARENLKIVVEGSSDKLLVNDSTVYIEKNNGEGNDEPGIKEVVAPFGNRVQILLADSSVIWLNVGSKLAFLPYHPERREVYLEGEAYFDIMFNKSRAFVVQTAGMDVRVLGTSFNVAAYPEQVTFETALISGEISIDKLNFPGKETVVLKPNQKAVYSKAENEIIVSDEPDIDNDIAWVQGWLVYQRENLGSVFEKIERYYNITLHVPPGFSTEDEISGKLDLNESFENIMDILSDAAGFEYSIKENDVFIQNLN